MSMTGQLATIDPTANAGRGMPLIEVPATASTPSDRLAWAEAEQARFGMLLIERGECSVEQVRAALWAAQVNGGSLVEALVQQQVIRHERLIELMQELNADQIATTIRFDVPVPDKQFLLDHKVVVFGMSSKALYLGCLGQEELVERYFERHFPRHSIKFMPLSSEVAQRYLGNLDMLPHTGEERLHYGDIEMVRYVSDQVADSEVLDLIVNLAGVRGASDIHIEPKQQSYTVFMRIDRMREIVHEGSLKQYAVVRAQVKGLMGADQTDTRKTQDGKFNKQIMGRMFDLRVNTNPTTYAGLESLVIRLLDPDRASQSLSDLGISRVDLLREIMSYPSGAFLNSGKTNSGKSTTLTSAMREMDRIGRALAEIGDPIESRLEFVTQIQVNRSAGIDLDFAAAIRSLMRADKEVLVIGEVRDEETAKAFATAAESGMFVMSTTHAGSISQTPGRLIGLGVTADVMKPVLRGVMSQRLIRKVCVVCAGEKKRGCPTCRRTGYHGMSALTEIVSTPAERDVERLFDRTLIYEPFAVDALRKLDAGVVDEREVHRVFATELKHVEMYSDDFPGVAELKLRVEAALADPGHRLTTMPPAPTAFDARQLETVEDRKRAAAAIESKLGTASLSRDAVSTGWSVMLGTPQ